MAMDLINNHKSEFGLARRKVEELKQSALSFPEDHLFVQMDSMDNQKSFLPRYREVAKDLAQKERLPAKITGCNIYSGNYQQNRKIFMFINHNIFENGSNFIITMLHHLLQDYLQEHKKFPRKLHLNVDNCWKGKS